MPKPSLPAQTGSAWSFDIATFRRKLLDWFSASARDLPWRRTLVPYHVWLSEIMLQQTQMDRAVGYFQRFVERFPDVASLDAAGEDEVLKLWEGLGYYSRARNLRRAARQIMERHRGVFPVQLSDIRALPGVGPYTAGAIASVAYNEPVPAVDANVLRVFARLLDLDQPVDTPAARRSMESEAAQLLDPEEPRAFNQALMELGALVCRPRKAECQACPVSAFCLAFQRGVVARRPVLRPGPETVRIQMACGVLASRGRILIQKRRADDVWPGLWEFPGGVLEEGERPEDALVRELREETALDVLPGGRIAVVRSSYTRYRITLHGFFCSAAHGVDPEQAFRLNEADEARFVAPDDLRAYAFPSGHARLVAKLLTDLRLEAFLAAD
ncbi:A/G-specific DNA-adenine glycosylase [Humidesulfovibrio mexicanus]|uniref:Adenine DNA glycosylase n=1 Tax=Humidesulfovibrio mexicanus TaxID=147047 RepID=A0A238XYD7_9BACT|nr:A/G-specific adenine glycosylase [Humidesulfovibrio mexicanus]SNR63433.1 A/G-specific DNA-adenine glycosylase [Humidesulfovibrio mexicanus]